MLGFRVMNVSVKTIDMTPQTTLTAPPQETLNKYLDSALLIAEAEDGGYEPISPVATINEAIEMAQTNFHRRAKELEQGRETMCPARYAVWARGYDGSFQRIHEFIH
jgi:hypothetical protein